MRIGLSEEDRKRFDCPEWLDIDLSRVTSREAAVMQKVLGFDSPLDLIEAWNEQWKKAPAKGWMDYDAWDAMVWLGLRQCGALKSTDREEMRAELHDLEYEVILVSVQVEDVDSGKGETESSSTQATTSTT